MLYQCSTQSDLWFAKIATRLRAQAPFIMRTMTTTENYGDAAALAAYTAGLASCFGISHIAPIHNFLHRHSPTFYPYLNVILPCGRAIFLLLLAERGARIFEQQQQQRLQSEQTRQ